MRFLDAIQSSKTIKNKENTEPGVEEQLRKVEKAGLCTVWSEQADTEDIFSEYPRPQFRRKNWINLNGYWNYAFTETSSRPEKLDGKILVPFAPESSRSGVLKRLEPGQYLWYCREVQMNIFPGKRLILHFDAVDQKCAVWWNGKALGIHENGYLPFAFDVTDYLKEGRNTIWVRVEDDTDQGTGCRGKQVLKPGGMFYTPVSGIWQTVWMEWVPEKRLDALKITPLFDESKVRLELTVTEPLDAEVEIHTGEETLAYCLHAEDFSKAADSDTQRYTAAADIEMMDVHPWSPEDPYLYEMTIRAGKDQVESYFAMRKFSRGVDEKGIPRLMLNNEPYFFHGILDQGYWPETLLTPPSDEAMIFDIEQIKRLGFNMMRKHIKIEPLRWYYHCDRIGMVVWQDMINGGGPIKMPLVTYLPTILPGCVDKISDKWYGFFSRTDKKAREKWIEDCIEMVNYLYNCPSIGLWVPFNEGWGQFEANRVTELIRQADPTRMIDQASGWYDQKGGDVKSVHNYFRKLKVEKDERPFVISEYGGYVLSTKGHTYDEKVYGYRVYKDQKSFAEAYENLMKEIYNLVPQGLCGAVYTQVSDIEEEINGLFTYDRKVCKVDIAEE